MPVMGKPTARNSFLLFRTISSLLLLRWQLTPFRHLWMCCSPIGLLLYFFSMTTVTWGIPMMHQTVNLVTTNNGVDLQRFSRSHFAFSLDLYSALANRIPSSDEGERGNLMFSPYSVSTALSMIFLGAGAGSRTSRQLRAALHLNNFSFSDVHDSYKAVLSKLADPYYTEVFVAINGIFSQEGVFISDKYQQALKEFYYVHLKPMDFVRNPQIFFDNINFGTKNFSGENVSSQKSEWFESFDSTLGITLVNGLAFRSNWLFKFDPSSTFDKGLFYITSKKRFEIPMMVGRFKIPVGYSADLECRIAELPFSSRRVSLFIILPDDVDRGITKLEANISSDNIKALFSTLKDETVNVRLPRFRLEHQSVELKHTLTAMGVHDVFDNVEADLSGISSGKLHVNHVIHKTFLEIKEDGVAEPTAPGMNRLGAFGEKYFEVDHPFIFFLWDYHTGILLFIGRITAPEPWIN